MKSSSQSHLIFKERRKKNRNYVKSEEEPAYANVL